MSGVGFWEVILVFLIGLIVLGPERLPRVARQLGTWLGQAQRMTRAMRRQLEDELNLEKELSIRPRTASLPPPQKKKEEEKDDTYSPAHESDAVGSGVDAPQVVEKEVEKEIEKDVERGGEDDARAATKKFGAEDSANEPGETAAQEKVT